MPSQRPLTRRTVLKTTGGSLVGLGATGLGSASADGATSAGDRVEINVGVAVPSGRDAALNAANEVVRTFDSLDVVTVRVPADAADALAKHPDVRYVERNDQVHALAETLPWGVDRVDAEEAHANGETGAGADVAIIDTGIDSDHPELQSHLGTGKAFVTCRPFENACGYCNYDWDDDNGHGTTVACIVASDDDSDGTVGVAPDATLHAVKALDYNGGGSISDVAAGIEYVADQGWDVANMSFGASSGYQTLKDAVAYAANEGVLLVAAAGGSGPCTDCVNYPAAYSEVVAVSATNRYDGLASFSSTGPEIDLAAPGTDIYACSCQDSDGYDTVSGTSFAAPHVTGGGAQVMAQGATNTDARDVLESTAEDVGLGSNESGAGLLDVAAALGLDSSDST